MSLNPFETLVPFQTESPEILGKTGDTTIYVSPNGVAHKSSQEKNTVNPYPRDFVSEQPTLMEAQPLDMESFIEELVAQGTLTEGQIQVVRYDQATTGLTLLEALIARNWLSEDLADDYWVQLQ